MNTQNDSYDLDDLVLEDQLYLLEYLIENQMFSQYRIGIGIFMPLSLLAI